jgi:hypothetical protein
VQYSIADLVGVQLPHPPKRGLLVPTNLQEHLGQVAATGSFAQETVRAGV